MTTPTPTTHTSVRPPHQAISAAVEDEDEYKKVTEELKEMCKVMVTAI